MQQTSTCTLDASEFERGILLSRNFQQRTKQETSYLYQLIQGAVAEAQNPQNAVADESLKFVTFVFEPLIKKTAIRIYPQVSKYEEFEDTIQETYVTFLSLLYSYNPVIASFPYYINKMLPQQVKAWGQRTRKKCSTPIDINTVDNLLADPTLGDKDSAYARYNSYIVVQEYEDFIVLRAERKAKSITVRQVCYDYFLGGKTCSQIAEHLGISYHAVYEVIKRIERDLKEFLEKESLLGVSIEDML